MLALSWACLLFGLVPFIIAGLNFVIYHDPALGSEPLSNIMILIWFFMGIAGFFAIRRLAKNATLTLSSDGIVCDEGILGGFSTRWEDIAAIQATRFRLCVVLTKPGTPNTRSGQWAVKHSLQSPDFIDLSSFIHYWQNGELKQDFERYVPHLFQDPDPSGQLFTAKSEQSLNSRISPPDHENKKTRPNALLIAFVILDIVIGMILFLVAKSWK